MKKRFIFLSISLILFPLGVLPKEGGNDFPPASINFKDAKRLVIKSDYDVNISNLILASERHRAKEQGFSHYPDFSLSMIRGISGRSEKSSLGSDMIIKNHERLQQSSAQVSLRWNIYDFGKRSKIENISRIVYNQRLMDLLVSQKNALMRLGRLFYRFKYIASSMEHLEKMRKLSRESLLMVKSLSKEGVLPKIDTIPSISLVEEIESEILNMKREFFDLREDVLIDLGVDIKKGVYLDHESVMKGIDVEGFLKKIRVESIWIPEALASEEKLKESKARLDLIKNDWFPNVDFRLESDGSFVSRKLGDRSQRSWSALLSIEIPFFNTEKNKERILSESYLAESVYLGGRKLKSEMVLDFKKKMSFVSIGKNRLNKLRSVLKNMRSTRSAYKSKYLEGISSISEILRMDSDILKTGMEISKLEMEIDIEIFSLLFFSEKFFNKICEGICFYGEGF